MTVTLIANVKEKIMANKKVLMALLLGALVAGGVFAQPAFKMSVGGGGLLELGTSGGGKFSGHAVDMYLPAVAGGGFAFFDATYAEASFGFAGGFARIMSEGSPNRDMSVLQLNLSLLGKYPFELTEKFTLFPLLGIGYQITLSVKDDDGNKMEPASDLNALWFKLGVGGDYSFTDNIYLRFSALFGIRTKTQVEKDMIDDYGADSVLGTGITAKIAVGYRF